MAGVEIKSTNLIKAKALEKNQPAGDRCCMEKMRKAARFYPKATGTEPDWLALRLGAQLPDPALTELEQIFLDVWEKTVWPTRC